MGRGGGKSQEFTSVCAAPGNNKAWRERGAEFLALSPGFFLLVS